MVREFRWFWAIGLSLGLASQLGCAKLEMADGEELQSDSEEPDTGSGEDAGESDDLDTESSSESDDAVDTMSDGGFDTSVDTGTGADTDTGTGADTDTGLGYLGSLALGFQHACFVDTLGGLKCWGYGLSGRLGYGNTNNIGDDEHPSSVVDVVVGGTVESVSGGGSHTCAVLENGDLYCWGNGGNGRLGYGNIVHIGDDETPSLAGKVDVGGTVTEVGTGIGSTCALLDTGKVRCWGRNVFGCLGYGNTDDIGDDELPSAAGDVSLGGTVTHIAVGGYHVCALLDTGKVRCWGENWGGQLGYGHTNIVGDNETPGAQTEVDVGGTVTQIAAGEAFTCALLDTQDVRCWGTYLDGRLGLGHANGIGDDEAPSSSAVVNVGGNVTQLACGRSHACVLLDTGKVRCWGDGDYGALGYGNTNDIGDNEHPSTAGDVDVGGTVVQIAAGDEFTCALLDTGSVRCWGRGQHGQLGYSNEDDIGDTFDDLPSAAGDLSL